jgi:hypothetical protein
MSDSKHTPGPWHWNPRDPYGVVADGDELCRVREPADARLIAAAPDLLAAAKAMIENYEHDDAWVNLRAAVRRAAPPSTTPEPPYHD